MSTEYYFDESMEANTLTTILTTISQIVCWTLIVSIPPILCAIIRIVIKIKNKKILEKSELMTNQKKKRRKRKRTKRIVKRVNKNGRKIVMYIPKPEYFQN